MSQLVVLNLGTGNWQQGFPNIVTQLWESESLSPIQFTGSLPPNTELPQLYKRWQLLYRALSFHLGWNHSRSNLAIAFDENDLTRVSDTEFSTVCQQLENQLNTWFHAESFQKIERRLRTKLSSSAEIRVIIETEDEELRRFPWHLWHFLNDYPKAEVALGTQEYERVNAQRKKTTAKVRLLAILGNSQGIEVQKDRILLEQLPDADTVFLVEPHRRELDTWLWDERGWDILFFAGHSSSSANRETGQLEINRNDAITIPQLKNALKAAIARGLQLAIFNSCDGLGLARDLADLQIPQLIVMREPVSDVVAQEFLKHWLHIFATGQSFYLGVREARERLQGLEDEFPCASWLPVICQNPAVVPPTWERLRSGLECAATLPDNRSERRYFLSTLWQRCRTLFTMSVAVTTVVMVLRLMGGLQSLEWWVFDHLLQLQPATEPDERLLIVTVTEQDIQNLGQYPLSDRILLDALKKLDTYQPRAIGLDIYRDVPVEPGHDDFATYLQHNQRLITICQVGELEANHPDKIGVPPPPDSPSENHSFSDISVDSDGVVRRHLFHLDPGASPCQVNYALSAELAFRYLEAEGIAIANSQGNLKLGNTVLKPLENHTGFYHTIDTRGHQVLLNYRSPQNFARTITLTDILNNQFSPAWVKNHIILMGVTAPSVGDKFSTPYGKAVNLTMPGVVIHAQMVSQFLSVAFGERTLLKFWSQWEDVIWIWGWSFAGSVFVYYFSSLWHQKMAMVAVLVIFLGICFAFFLLGVCLPIVPSILAIGATWGLILLPHPKT